MADSDSDSDAPPTALPSSSSAAAAAAEKSGRANKNRPSELSTKRKVDTFRVAPGLKASAQHKGRDPRFDPHASASDFNEEGWRKSYDFVFEKQREEVAEMKASLAASQKAKSSKRRQTRKKALGADAEATMRLELDKAQNRVVADDRKQKKLQAKAAVRREELAAVQQGKKPFFAKKSQLRDRELLAQYEELKKTKKLDKFIQKKRRKIDGKQHRAMPSAANDYG